jgi:hypothetical protein
MVVAVAVPAVVKPASGEGAPSEKMTDKDDDPFSDLGSLEAEMARLLGRGPQN